MVCRKESFLPVCNGKILFIDMWVIFPADSNPVLAPGSFGILGLNFNPLYNFSKYFRAGVSLDMQYDESANIGNHVANDYFPSDPDELQFYRPPFREQFSAGLSLRAEIVMPIFSINLGIGKNFFCHGADNNIFSCIRVISCIVSRTRTTWCWDLVSGSMPDEEIQYVTFLYEEVFSM